MKNGRIFEEVLYRGKISLHTHKNSSKIQIGNTKQNETAKKRSINSNVEQLEHLLLVRW